MAGVAGDFPFAVEYSSIERHGHRDHAPRDVLLPLIFNVELSKRVTVRAADPEREATLDRSDALDAQVKECFAELGTLVTLDDSLVDVAMGLMSCGPAYVALVAEAQVDAGVRHGIPAEQGAALVVQTLAGTAELLRRRDYDMQAVRREVSSPGGLTARGVDALERGGLRAAFSEAMDAVLRPS